MSARLPALASNLSLPDLTAALNDRLRRIDAFPVPVTVTSPASTVPPTSASTGLKSPLNFGGKGDGGTDDSAAVAQAAALGYLWLPPGYTFVTIGVLITQSDFSVFGGGALMLKAGTGTDLLTFDGSAFTLGTYPGNGTYGHVSGVTLHGNASHQPVNLGACLVLKNAAYTCVQDCLIYAGSGDGIRLENANSSPNADEVNIINNRIFSNGRHGIYAHSTCLPVITTIAASIAIGSHVVTPASMLNIQVGSTLIVGGEYVVVNVVTGSTFTSIFTATHTGPGITVISTFGHVGDHVIAFNHCNYNGRAGIRGTYLTSGIIQGNNVLTNAIGIWLDGADRCVLTANATRNNKGSGVIVDQHATVNYTDLVIATATTVASVLHNFSDEDIGLQLAITGGVGFTVQTVMILGLDSLGHAIVSANLGTVGSSGGIGSKNGFGRSKEILINGCQIHFNGVQTTADELDVFNTDGCVIDGNYLGDTDFTPVAQYGIQLFNSTGIVIEGNTFGPTIHGPLLAPITAGIQHPYRSLGNIGLSDGMQATQANLPTPALNDYGILCTVSDYQHTLLWIGTQWVYQLGDSGSGWIVNSVGGVLTAGVWHPCDGTTATILNGDGTTQVVTTPNLNALVLNACYMRR